jgi:chitin disaccharide deacetylase
VPQLIVNADDFGLTPGVNRAIIEAHRRGIVTSATLMANSAAFDDAVQLAKENPSLAIGCHIVLMDGEPLSSREQVESLLSDGRGFRADFASFAWSALRGRIRPEHVEREATSQMRKIQQSGIQLSHFDAHKHAHMLPMILRPLLRAAQACGVRALRNPFAPIRPLAYAHLFRRPRLWKRYTEVKLLRGWCDAFRRLVADAGMVTTDGSFGVLSTGALDLPLFQAIAGCIPDGTWEFVCHPGYDDADLDRVRTRLRASRVLELKVLTSPEARKALDGHQIQLTHFAQLAQP